MNKLGVTDRGRGLRKSSEGVDTVDDEVGLDGYYTARRGRV